MNRKLWTNSKVNHSSGFNILSYFYIRDLGYSGQHSGIQLYSFPRPLRNYHKYRALKDHSYSFLVVKLRAKTHIGRAMLFPNSFGVCHSLFLPEFLMAHQPCYPLAYIYSPPPVHHHLIEFLLFLCICLPVCVTVSKHPIPYKDSIFSIMTYADSFITYIYFNACRDLVSE